MRIGQPPSVAPELVRWLRDVQMQLNSLSEGALHATHNALPSRPTKGRYAQGDFVRNSAPEELGATGAKYVIFGWQCTVAGEPGTWVECRFQTGA